MNKVIKLKDVIVGEGLPKICVPMVGETLTQLVEEADYLKNLDLDIVEWRVDFFENVESIEAVMEALKTIRTILAEKPIIFTFRSLKEGGNKDLSSGLYFELNKSIALSGLVDVIDVELFNQEEDIRELIDVAHQKGVAVIVSNHDFHATPSKEEIISRLRKAAELGGDLPKIAVMPVSTEDVITLLDATRIMKETHGTPVITMSMSGKGVISRLSGELFGSVITFGAAKKASAPGQISTIDLRRTLKLLHENL